MNIHCPVCGSDTDKPNPYNSELRVCFNCNHALRGEQYEIIQSRIDKGIETVESLLRDADREGDQETVQFAKDQIAKMKQQKSEMNKP